MYRIAEVEINGFWGKHTVKTHFFSAVNIFIGKNGTGKTTFINILESILRVDLKAIQANEFSSVNMRLVDENGSNRTLIVKKTIDTDSPFDRIDFKIGKRLYKIPILARDTEYYSRSLISQSIEHDELRATIAELINLSSLSVHRTVFETSQDDEYVSPRRRTRRPPIDSRLEELMQGLTRYQLSLAEQANKVSSDFQKGVLASILYDVDFDTFDVSEIRQVELGKEKLELSKAYRELGAWDRQIAQRIDLHIRVLTKSLESVQEFKNNDTKSKSITIDHIMPLPLLKRTQHIMNLSLIAQSKKQDIFTPINNFLTMIREFITDKEFEFGSSGEMLISKDKKRIKITDLSSGEKQLLILLTETLLQKNEFFIFIADEPEISLHIEWQAKIISSIKKINRNSQVIVATHSPEIAGRWANNLIDMGDIIYAKH